MAARCVRLRNSHVYRNVMLQFISRKFVSVIHNIGYIIVDDSVMIIMTYTAYMTKCVYNMLLGWLLG